MTGLFVNIRESMLNGKPLQQKYLMQRVEFLYWCPWQWEWVDNEASKSGTDYYYPRIVLKDGETAWGSPIWVRT